MEFFSQFHHNFPKIFLNYYQRGPSRKKKKKKKVGYLIGKLGIQKRIKQNRKKFKSLYTW